MISQSTIDNVLEFSRERDWEQFHTIASLSRSIVIESAELLECFQWQDTARNEDWEAVQSELADVLTYCILMADALHVDLDTIINKKLEISRKKYPIAKSKGTSKKYTEL